MDYQKSDVEVVYRRGDWNSWSDIVRRLEGGLSRDQQADNELSEAESRQLLDGFRRLDQKGERFTDDPAGAYRALQSVQ
ncbi:hypothetical protein U2F26_06100 [Micromonospora sp. 4G57]|uniref:Uncharacterized protein n=1 Tax=Micromonospora sicca TaxID=2202420 RepID=A0ABU5J9A8_9ACTN|nr:MULTISPECIES: hypothetical protein [unclassified Micromonospora]MDZ5442305.1 hypothetical protein [Micromonospora sp. 4G57]MDZ5489110.1 hypothetical protein [Micromonospora sp. 4G53]